MDYSKVASKESLETTIEALNKNGFEVIVAESEADAKAKALDLIPEGAEVMQATSVTLDTLGISAEINESGKYDSVKNKLAALDRETQSKEMQKLGAAPDYVIGSVHAVTEDGKVLVVSNTGSQLPSYAYGASKVIWVVGTQKIVKDIETAYDRVRTHTLALESVRVQAAYGMPSSFISKEMVFNREIKPGRITIIFVNENIGY